jgi:hypothetical protein
MVAQHGAGVRLNLGMSHGHHPRRLQSHAQTASSGEQFNVPH